MRRLRSVGMVAVAALSLAALVASASAQDAESYGAPPYGAAPQGDDVPPPSRELPPPSSRAAPPPVYGDRVAPSPAYGDRTAPPPARITPPPRYSDRTAPPPYADAPPPAGPRVVTAAPPGLVGRAPLRRAFAVKGVSMLSGPGPQFNLVQIIPEGTEVGVGKCSGGWCEVVWQRRHGFAPATALAIAGSEQPGFFLPAYAAAPDYYDGPTFFWGASFACCGHRWHHFHRRW